MMSKDAKNITEEPGVDAEGDSDIVKDHIALQNQSDVDPDQYPDQDKKDASVSRIPD